MAHDAIFDGPMSESVPTGVSSFVHRGSRSQSNASQQRPSLGLLSMKFFGSGYDVADNDDAVTETSEAPGGYDDEDGFAGTDMESQAGDTPMSEYGDPLLHRTISGESDFMGMNRKKTSQRAYLQEEDLTIVIAGFRTHSLKIVFYYLLCICTFGLAYLLLRWLPRWWIRMTAVPSPLEKCDWVVIENQWGEVSIHDIFKRTYGREMSTVFSTSIRYVPDDPENEDPTLPVLRSVDYRYTRFVWHPYLAKFIQNNNWKDPSWKKVKDIRQGIDGDIWEDRIAAFGSNVIDIEQKSMGQLLVDEALHPFYIFQVGSIILWSFDEYYYYAACIFVISVGSIITTLIETKENMTRLKEMSRFVCEVRVLRNGFWRSVSSEDLVPGDVYEVSDPSLTVFPCDALLLSGDAIVNESMLTGESVPVSKLPTTDKALRSLNLSSSGVNPDIAKHFLFSGTKIIRVRRPQARGSEDAAALAMVVRTGFNTTKGALIRSMLFPRPVGFKFYRDSFRFIGVMGIIACFGFILSTINFVKLGLHWTLILVRALDLITIVVPPALPATLSIGTNFAIGRLRKKDIFCISPQRVNVGGKIDVMCFDKTGTLTEDGLDILGVRAVDRVSNQFYDLYGHPEDLLPSSEFERDPSKEFGERAAILYAMTTCHSLKLVGGELVGDPLDLKMFDFTEWIYEEGGETIERGRMSAEDAFAAKPVAGPSLNPPTVRPPGGRSFAIEGVMEGSADPRETAPMELGVLKVFEFVSHLRRMSVLVKRFRSTTTQVYVKGAPEIMPDICDPNTFPADYDELLAYYTHHGYRVIACAAKTIPKLSFAKAQKMKREEAEKDLTFLGFIIFENKLKPSTAGAIKQLAEANIRKVMCTGDNILTAISVARECGLVSEFGHVFVPQFEIGNSFDPNSKVTWHSVDNSSLTLDSETLLPMPAPAEADASLPYEAHNINDYSLAVSGDVFRWLVDYAPLSVLQRMLIKGQIFARMSPDEKHELVEKLQSLDYCVGFCGDGANDCGALKAADVGISLSEAEASVAAPFTSRSFEISCVLDVIREGRAALVTSFSCFKYMALYSAIQFTTVSLLYKSGSNLGNFQFLFIDLFLIIPISIFMGRSEPYPVISIKRPTANLVSKKVITSMLGHIVVLSGMQFLVYFMILAQPWYKEPIVDPDNSTIESAENTALFAISSYQYILIAIVLSVGPPYRKPMSQNLPFILSITFTALFVTYFFLDPPGWLASMLQLVDIPYTFRAFIVILAGINLSLALAGEEYIFTPLAKAYAAFKEKTRSVPKERKKYKVIQEGMLF
ncbi:hypothetical protein YB2330_002510 [Saitoella coloradoensis]